MLNELNFSVPQKTYVLAENLFSFVHLFTDCEAFLGTTTYKTCRKKESARLITRFVLLIHGSMLVEFCLCDFYLLKGRKPPSKRMIEGQNQCMSICVSLWLIYHYNFDYLIYYWCIFLNLDFSILYQNWSDLPCDQDEQN